MSSITAVDVLIVGAGPVGLLMAYQLARVGVSVHLIDKDTKSSGGNTGRANALYSRSAELLDQLGLIDRLVQECHIVRESYTYNAQGERVIPGRVWNFVENIEDTHFDFAIMLRQQFIENCLRDHLESFGVHIHVSTECIKFDSTSPDMDGNRVISVLRNALGEEYTIKSKYMIGADGGRSFVRRYLDVPFEGDTTADKWIRIDGTVKTDMPTPRDYASIESPTHGNVLWAPLDRDVIRVGYVYTPTQEKQNEGQVTEEIAKAEAIKAVKPFNLEFESVKWWTLYVIGQRVAATYRPRPGVILVGDACHTHSSGAAQGLNTGIHDACNLGWKLTMVLKGLAKEELLDTYEAERRGAAQRLISFDRRISTLMANKWPDDRSREANADINRELAEAFDEAAGYNTGLAIFYTANLINKETNDARVHTSVQIGHRAPDLTLMKPGTLEMIRLYSALPNVARMQVLAFTGDPRITLPRIKQFSSYLGSPDSFSSQFTDKAVRIITIVATANQHYGVEEALGVFPFGIVYYDSKRNGHRRYNVNVMSGALVVVRPDGYIGFCTSLDTAGGIAVLNYLDRFLVRRIKGQADI